MKAVPPSIYPPNSLELFTLFSLPFLHFYNFLGTQVEWSEESGAVRPPARWVVC